MGVTNSIGTKYAHCYGKSIAAMREPTEKMLGALHGCLPDYPDKHASIAAREKWQRTIDAIIKE